MPRLLGWQAGKVSSTELKPSKKKIAKCLPQSSVEGRPRLLSGFRV